MEKTMSLVISKIRIQLYFIKAIGKKLSLKLKLDYKIIKRYALFFLSILYVGYSYTTYVDYKKETSKHLLITAQKIENVINDLFNQHSLLIQYIGSEIAAHNDPNDLLFIRKILETLSNREFNTSKILSWSLFDWVSSSGNIVVNQKIGILKPSQSIFVADRDYVPKAKVLPWALHLSPPDIARVSQIWVIPAGFGITDKDGKFLGIITMGFNVESLNNILKEHLEKDSSDLSFVILDKHNNIILKSSDNIINERSEHYKNLLNNNNPFIHFSNFLKQPIKYNTIEYTYYKKLDRYQYTILVGLNANVTNKRLLSAVFLLTIKLSCLTLIILTILYLYHTKYTKTAQAANQAKQQLTQKTIQQLKLDIELIYQYSRILSNHLKGDLQVIIPADKQIEIISHIETTALNLKNFSIASSNMDYINVEKLIEEVMVIHSHYSLIKDISLAQEIQNKILPFFANELGIKQILTSLISRTLESIPKGGNFKIRAFMQETHENKFLTIVLVDDGFWLSEEELDRISKKFFKNNDHDADLIHLDRETITNLIKLHNGTYTIEQGQSKGKTATLKFPYIMEKTIPSIETKKYETYH